MRKHIILALSLGFATTSTLMTSCKHVTTECSSCKTLSENSKATLTIANNHYQMKIWDGKNDYHFAYTETSGDMLNSATAIIGNTLNPDEKLATVVFYVNPLPKDGATVTSSDVLGYGIYFLKENKLRYRFYLKTDNQYKIIPELNCEVTVMSSNDISDIAKLYFGQGTSSLAITCRDILFSPNGSKSHTLGYNIKFLYRKNKPVINGRVTAAPPGGSECQPPCSAEDHDCDNTLHGWSCDYTTSGENDAQQATALSDGGVVPQSLIDSAYDPTTHYNFRDSFLFKHTLTRKYVDYYYGMTPEAYLTSDILSRMPAYLQKLNAKAIQILTNQNSVVLIDASFRDESIALLELYRAAAPNATERAYFVDIENDVTNYTGMTIGAIVATLD